MAKSTTIASVILGASIGIALLKFYGMSKEERNAFFDHIKNTTNDLLDNAENTVEKVEHFMDEIKSKEKDEWIEKFYVLKKMFRDLYNSKEHYFL